MKRVLSIVLAVTVVACGKEIVGPRSGVTLLVTNGTCLAGHCDSLRVLAFPSDLPNTPGGPWKLDLGVMTTSQECFVLPPSANFYVNTTTFTWTTLVPLSLGHSHRRLAFSLPVRPRPRSSRQTRRDGASPSQGIRWLCRVHRAHRDRRSVAAANTWSHYPNGGRHATIPFDSACRVRRGL